jgi:GH15 family glucan-1,4-alpha-glucosidase
LKRDQWRKFTPDQTKDEYKPIEDYGIIGDMQTCALVSIDGSIDWFCTPRFDSPSVFGALLDKKKGGRFSIRPKSETFEVRQNYEYHTNILITEFATKTGSFSVIDFMPCFQVESAMIHSGEIHRRIKCTSGSVDCEIMVQPRMQYGKVVPGTEYFPRIGYSFSSKEPAVRQRLSLLTTLEFEKKDEPSTLHSVLSLNQSEQSDLVLRYGGTRMDRPQNAHTEEKLTETREYWLRWIARARYKGKWKEEVLRSALALKLLVYAPTGAILAAPTTSLPEGIGGVRNWDYRYSWIRDSSFVLWAFHSLGYNEEAMSYIEWFMNSFYLCEDNLQIMTGVGGERDLTEHNLDHLEGYKRSFPVRVGNGAWNQFQLDLYGIVLDALYFSHKHGKGIEKKVFRQLIMPLVDSLIKQWERPDCGIWEVRGKPEHFVYSKMWCWVAVDRGLKIAGELGLSDEVKGWIEARDKIHNQIMEKGYDHSVKSFVRSYGSKELDAANLLMPQVRFIKANDPRMVSTIDQVQLNLMRQGKFLYRYRSEDGLPGNEGAFLICSFWLVNCLTQIGRLEEAENLLNALIGNANHLGLFSEEVNPETGSFLGNFPQAFTHMGFITAATALHKAIHSTKKG